MDIEKPPPLTDTATRFHARGQPLRQLGGGLKSKVDARLAACAPVRSERPKRDQQLHRPKFSCRRSQSGRPPNSPARRCSMPPYRLYRDRGCRPLTRGAPRTLVARQPGPANYEPLFGLAEIRLDGASRALLRCGTGAGCRSVRFASLCDARRKGARLDRREDKIGACSGEGEGHPNSAIPALRPHRRRLSRRSKRGPIALRATSCRSSRRSVSPVPQP